MISNMEERKDRDVYILVSSKGRRKAFKGTGEKLGERRGGKD